VFKIVIFQAPNKFHYSFNILSECLRILIDCNQLSKCYSLNVRRYNASCMTIAGGITEQHVIEVSAVSLTGFTSDFLGRNNRCWVIPPEKITRKASDAAGKLHL